MVSGGTLHGATAMTVNDHVEPLGQTFITDGMIMDENGVLYFTARARRDHRETPQR